ncbi:plasmid recombination protein [Clostridium sp.]|uniref:plasmid recombination protein n=1 Tax=Clostridium sp. TaxID=1506 RepID=UPI00290BF639|nr:plasmid recombination protein [Clostridium sp.]MDU7005723.1 plasmid recombination protein [Clostridium sp.]
MTVTTHLSIAYTKTKSVSKAQQNHTERFDNTHKHTNKSIDPSKSADNINLRPEYEGMSYKQRFDAIVNSDRYTGRRRKDGSAMVIEGGKNATVKMLQLSVNIGQVDEDGNPVDTLSKDDYIKLYRDDILPMLEDTFGADNIIGSAIHVDESKPHLHVDIVPLTPEGKLSAKQVVGGRGKMHQRQKQWLETMQEKRPDLNFQRKKEGVNGLELEKLKELTEIAKNEAGEWLKDMRAEYNARLHILSSAKNVQEREQVRLNSWERRLKQTEQAQTDKARELAQDQKRLDEALPLLDKVAEEQMQLEKQQAEKSAELDAREKTVEGRESAVARREQGIEKTVAERTEKAVGERTRALDSRERVLADKEQDFDKRLSKWESTKIALVGALQKIPTAMQALAWWRKQSEDEDADKVADAIAEQVDAHTDKAITALADERLDEVQEHTDALTKTTDALEDGLDPEQFALPNARELPSAQEVAESVNIDPSQFEVSNRQLTQG